MVKSISKIYQNLKCMPPLASTRFYISICVLFWGPESTGYAFLGPRDLPLSASGRPEGRGKEVKNEWKRWTGYERNGVTRVSHHLHLPSLRAEGLRPKVMGKRRVSFTSRSFPWSSGRVSLRSPLPSSEWRNGVNGENGVTGARWMGHKASGTTRHDQRTRWTDANRIPDFPWLVMFTLTPLRPSARRAFFWGPESNGYAFLGAGVQWICFFGARSPMDMLFWDTRKPRDLPLDMLFWGPESNGYVFLGPRVQSICFFWGPESNGYAFLGYQKTKGFATGYAFLGPGVPWICFFGARSPLDMLFCDTRKPRDLPLDMLFWGPESNFLYLSVPSYNL